MLVALSADDFRPLIAYHHLDAGTGVERRLEKALANLTALRQVTAEAVREERLDVDETLALAAMTADEIEAVGQRLAASCVANLEHRLSSATSESSARGTSLSITSPTVAPRSTSMTLGRATPPRTVTRAVPGDYGVPTWRNQSAP